MYRLLTRQDIRDIENVVNDRLEISSSELMSRAGSAVADYVETVTERGAKIAFVCGAGNNGGDGWVAARILHESGYNVKVYTLKDPLALNGLVGDMAYEATSAGVHWEYFRTAPAIDKLEKYDVIVDAIIGIGFEGDLSENVEQWCNLINYSSALTVSVDVPTGIDADTGIGEDCAVQSQTTVTFLGAKLGLALGRGAFCAGSVVVDMLGIEAPFEESIEGIPELWTDSEHAQFLPLPAYSDNKYSRGRLLIVAGSDRYCGAALLAAEAATRSGAGYVTLLSVQSVVNVAHQQLPTVCAVALPQSPYGHLSTEALQPILEFTTEADVLLLGPGISTCDETYELIRDLVSQSPIPLVLDADGLGAFGGKVDLLKECEQEMILTPHAGEMARLIDMTSDAVADFPLLAAQQLSGENRTIVMKGTSTVITNGSSCGIDMMGPPTLATAGSGDVLAGIIAGLYCQELHPYLAAGLGVRLQARAALSATEELTPLCMNAHDLIDHLPWAVHALIGDAEEDDDEA